MWEEQFPKNSGPSFFRHILKWHQICQTNQCLAHVLCRFHILCFPFTDAPGGGGEGEKLLTSLSLKILSAELSSRFTMGDAQLCARHSHMAMCLWQRGGKFFPFLKIQISTKFIMSPTSLVLALKAYGITENHSFINIHHFISVFQRRVHWSQISVGLQTKLQRCDGESAELSLYSSRSSPSARDTNHPVRRMVATSENTQRNGRKDSNCHLQSLSKRNLT